VKLLFLLMTLLLFSNSAIAKEAALKTKEELKESFHNSLTLERVIDGDTIVASGKKIRLWGINAPEKKAPFFMPAKILLESLLNDGRLTCKFIEKDRYNRDVMHCLIGGLDVGSMMVQAGMAKDYSMYSGDYYQHEEDLAKSKKRGMWNNRGTGEAHTLCTMDAKVCSDGSYVSRTGPNCEFALCPYEK